MKNNKNIIIAGRIWDICYTDEEHQEGRRGATYKELQSIHINPSIHKDLQEVTLIHELLHACSDHAGVEDGAKLTEEEFITRIAPVLTQVLKENHDMLI